MTRAEDIYKNVPCNATFSIFAPDKSGTLFSDQNGKVFNDYIQL